MPALHQTRAYDMPLLAFPLLAQIFPALSYYRRTVLGDLAVFVHVHYAGNFSGDGEDVAVEREVGDDGGGETGS